MPGPWDIIERMADERMLFTNAALSADSAKNSLKSEHATVYKERICGSVVICLKW